MEGDMGNRPHPYRRQDAAAFEADCDRAFVEGTALDAAERAARIEEYETSQEQREWEGHDDDCEAEFISEAGHWSYCECESRQQAWSDRYNDELSGGAGDIL